MAWHERLDRLEWIPLKGVARGVSITKLLGVAFDRSGPGGHELRWSVATIEPGGQFDYHQHPHPQCFYFVKGTGEVATDEGVIPVGPAWQAATSTRQNPWVTSTGPSVT